MPHTTDRAYVLARIRRNPFLQGAMVAALVCYGGVCALIIWQDPEAPRLHAVMAAFLLCMSLASWSLLFWWFPVLARTQRALDARGTGRLVPRLLEGLATGCILIVHALFLWIVLHTAGMGG